MKSFFLKSLFSCLFTLFCLIGVFSGCQNKQEQTPADSVSGENITPPAISLPSKDMLAALGQENDIPIHRLVPHPFYVITGKPKHVLASPIFAGNEQFLAGFLRQRLLPPIIDPLTIERFVVSYGFPRMVQVNVANPQNTGTPQLQDMIVASQATIMTLDKPTDISAILMPLLGKDIDPALIESLKRTEGKNVYYDITRQDVTLPTKIIVGLIDERTVIFAEGTDSDIKSIFSDTVEENPVIQRLKHAPVEANDFVFLTSLEGYSQDMLDNLRAQWEASYSADPDLVKEVHQNLRSATLLLNISVPVGQPIITVDLEGRDAKGAQSIGGTVSGLVIMWQTAMQTMSEEAKASLPIHPDLIASLLNALTVEVNGTQTHVALENFETLIPTLAQFVQLNQIEVFRRMQIEQFGAIVERCIAYDNEHSKLPADILDTNGKPLLSWRVALLPMLGRDDLYQKFKLDEPWDSETNKALLQEMPIIYRHLTLGTEPDPTKTAIRFFDSAPAPFSKRDVRMKDIENPNGTLMFVKVAPEFAVEWTKPMPLEFQLDNVENMLGNPVLGVKFSGEIVLCEILPETDGNYMQSKRMLESLVHGTPMTEIPIGDSSGEPAVEE